MNDVLDGSPVRERAVVLRGDAHASPGRGLATREALLEAELDELDALPTGQASTPGCLLLVRKLPTHVS
jgi:hypothetical protein